MPGGSTPAGMPGNMPIPRPPIPKTPPKPAPIGLPKPPIAMCGMFGGAVVIPPAAKGANGGAPMAAVGMPMAGTFPGIMPTPKPATAPPSAPGQ